MQDGDGTKKETSGGGGERENSEWAFHAYGNQMKAVTEFRYLRRLLTATDDDWPAVACNIWKARAIWGQLALVLEREGEDPKVSQSFYTAVIAESRVGSSLCR